MEITNLYEGRFRVSISDHRGETREAQVYWDPLEKKVHFYKGDYRLYQKIVSKVREWSRETEKDTSAVGEIPLSDIIHGGDSEADEAEDGDEGDGDGDETDSDEAEGEGDGDGEESWEEEKKDSVSSYFRSLSDNLDKDVEVDTQELERLLRSLLGSSENGEPGPNWDKRRLSTRLLSFQSPNIDDREVEFGSKAALLCDTSGSMGPYVSWALAFTKEMDLENVVIGTIPNGYVREVMASDGPIAWEGPLTDLTDDFSLDRIIVIGDDDGEEIYQEASQDVSLARLSPYCCNYGDPEEVNHDYPLIEKVGSVKDIIRGLRILRRCWR